MSRVRPAFSSATPHFFNIVVRKTLRDKKIRIPKKFVKKYGETISSPAFLELPSGFEWQVGLETSCDGEMWLRNGWPEFVDQLSIRRGHVLVFRYEGNSRFHVIVFDTSTTEIEYPINPTLHFDICSQDNDADEDQLKDPKREDVETTDDSVQILDNHFSALPKTENKSSLQCPPPRKRMRAPTVSLSTSSSSSSSTLEPEVVRSKRRLSPSDASNPLFIDISETETSCPVCSAKRNNVTSVKKTPSDCSGDDKSPCFQVLMRLHNVEHGNYVRIPASFAMSYFGKMRKSQNVKLRVKKRGWDVKMLYSSPRNRYTFSAGWIAFSRDNSLRLGDTCRFQMIDKDPIVFQVSITRTTSSP